MSKQYDYLYKRKIRVPVEVDAKLRMKLVYILYRLSEDLEFDLGCNPASMRNNTLLDIFEEMVDNIERPDLIKKYDSEFETHNEQREHISFPDRKNKRRAKVRDRYSELIRAARLQP